jgi:hypothetical protein
MFIMNSGNCFVVGILVAMSCQFPSNGGRGACFLGLILTVTSCGSVIVQTFVALFSTVFSMILCSW